MYLAYSVGLPIGRHRPVFLSVRKLQILCVLSILPVAAINVVSIAVPISFLFFITAGHFEVIVGLATVNVMAAAERTIRGIMARAHVDTERSAIVFADPPGDMNIRTVASGTVHIVSGKLPDTPKNKLFQENLKKMIDNYQFTF